MSTKINCHQEAKSLWGNNKPTRLRKNPTVVSANKCPGNSSWWWKTKQPWIQLQQNLSLPGLQSTMSPTSPLKFPIKYHPVGAWGFRFLMPHSLASFGTNWHRHESLFIHQGQLEHVAVGLVARVGLLILHLYLKLTQREARLESHRPWEQGEGLHYNSEELAKDRTDSSSSLTDQGSHHSAVRRRGARRSHWRNVSWGYRFLSSTLT